MDSAQLLSDVTAFRTYAKYLSTQQRRETLQETINRNMIMHLERFPSLSKKIVQAYSAVHDLKIMPSMRSLQFAGNAVDRNNIRMYNCSFLSIDDIRAFGEILFLLLSGTGVGYSIQHSHIRNLPAIRKPTEEGIFKVHDSTQGWAQALDTLIEAYMLGRIRPVFDFSAVRPKGSVLSSTGAKAPGPEPLKKMLEHVELYLRAAVGRKLTSLEVHDVICISSDCVLAGGIRRSALICLFDRDDEQMLKCKSGNWHQTHPWRGRANNSAILPRELVTKEEFDHIFSTLIKNGTGEPGFSWSANLEMGFNPCHEVSLNPFQFCNLVTNNIADVKDKKDFLRRLESSAFISTLQAAYTDFPYLRDSWKKMTEKEALIGVSLTGICDYGSVPAEWLNEGAELVKKTNEMYAKKIGINPAARTTTLKPEGSSSCVLKSSSGVHDRYDHLYIRRIQITRYEDLAIYLSRVVPELMEDVNESTVALCIPIKSPPNATTERTQKGMETFKRAMFYNTEWIAPGHRIGDNHNNVSCTVHYHPDEVEALREAMWKERFHYSGISLFPYFDAEASGYQNLPFQSIDQVKFDQLSKVIEKIDLTKVVEMSDNTDRNAIIACAGGACEINL